MNMARRAPKVDANQRAIVEALRAVGASVQTLASVGCGTPDLLVGYQARNHLIEVKDGGKPPSARRLTREQIAWHQTWQGRVFVANSADEALAIIGAAAEGCDDGDMARR